ncbi:MAG TPA: hypothetical protein VES19_02315 [Candidatus Limnocylindrales bacterium]|nr:hypothetical protein [Candidatus Limnocylindrales bacterium]
MSQRRVVRTFDAPTRGEAEVMAAPVIDAFRDARWTEQERLWIPGDRRVGLGESLLLDADDQALLEANGTLRIAWITEDDSALEPGIVAAPRVPDRWEELGGTRYRRVVPRWIIGLAIFAIGAVVLLTWWSSMTPRTGGGPVVIPGDLPSFSGFPPAADGTCQEGYALEVEGGQAVCWPDEYFRFFDKTPSPADAMP